LKQQETVMDTKKVDALSEDQLDAVSGGSPADQAKQNQLDH